MSKPMSVSQSLKVEAIEEIVDKIADHQDALYRLRDQRDDLIRDLLRSGMYKSQIARIAELSREQVKNIEHHRYSRDTRRRRVRNPGPERD